MGFRRYVAPSAREAMERIRKELGPDAVILSNRRSANTGRVEIIAAAPGEVRALVDDFVPAGAPSRRREPAPLGRAAEARPAAPARAGTAPESFQEFIRRQAPAAAATGAPVPRDDVLALYRAMAEEGAGTAEFAPAHRAVNRPPAEAPAVFRRRPSRLDEALPPVAAPPRRAPLAAAPVDPDLAEGWAQPAALARSEERRPDWMVLQPAGAAPALGRSAARSAAPTAAPAAAAPTPPPVAAAAAPPAAIAARPPAPPATANLDASVMAELQSLRAALTDRIAHLEKQIVPPAAPAAPAASAGAAAAVAAAPAAASAAASAAAPAAAAPLLLKRQAMTRLVMSGFSPELARRLGDSVPPNLDGKEVDVWLQNNLAQQIRCPAETHNVLDLPGAVALVGPTGVGKTTTAAKLAARFVVRHGAAALGLITLDSYRMGAHEQLRGYGRILGVPVQVAHDGASLRDLLAAMHGKRKVLIDTCGMSQRDQRLGEMLAMLAESRFAGQEVPRVLLLNAASHAETLDEVARAWRVTGAHGAILTKLDEAARIGGGLDALIRYQLPLLGLTNGQRVPEDWHPGNAGLLAHIALKPFGAAFALDSAEIQNLTSTGVALV